MTRIVRAEVTEEPVGVEEVAALVGDPAAGADPLVSRCCGRARVRGGAARVARHPPARVFPVIVLAGDIDPVAVDTARANVIANGLDGRVECVEAAGFDHPMIDDNAPYDLVFANILKQPLIDLVPDMGRRVAHGGRAILSGILTTQADEVIAAYAKGGLALESRDDYGDWSTLVVRRA